MLGLFDGNDTAVSLFSVRAGHRARNAAGRPVTSTVSADANHTFANSSAQAYDAAAAMDAWDTSLACFRAKLR